MSDLDEHAYPDRVTFKDASGVVRYFCPETAWRHWSDGMIPETVLSWVPEHHWLLWENFTFIGSELHKVQILSPPEAAQWLFKHGEQPPDGEALEQLELGAKSDAAEPIEVFDEDQKKDVMFDPTDCKYWHSNKVDEKYYNGRDDYPERWEDQTLYHHPADKWLLVADRYHSEVDLIGSFICRVSKQKAAHWLFWHKFEVPSDLQGFIKDLEFDINAEPGSSDLESDSASHSEVPVWKADDGVLTFRGQEIRSVRATAANVRKLLDVFHEDQWATLVDNPFPDGQKMREAIASANKGLRLIHFEANGNGEGMRWQCVDDPEPGDTSSNSEDVPF